MKILTWSGLRSGKLMVLFPFDGARGFGGNVVDDAVDAVHLVDDAVGDAGQEIVGEAGPVGGPRVLGGDGADHERVGVGAAVALDADRADRRHHREALPQLAVEPEEPLARRRTARQ